MIVTVEIVLFIAAILAGAFLCGFFESFIVKECTECGKHGKTTPLCWRYEGAARGAGLVGFRLGVLHSVHLCEKCLREVLMVQFGFYGR